MALADVAKSFGLFGLALDDDLQLRRVEREDLCGIVDLDLQGLGLEGRAL